jgi:hypothetical protein
MVCAKAPRGFSHRERLLVKCLWRCRKGTTPKLRVPTRRPPQPIPGQATPSMPWVSTQSPCAITEESPRIRRSFFNALRIAMVLVREVGIPAVRRAEAVGQPLAVAAGDGTEVVDAAIVDRAAADYTGMPDIHLGHADSFPARIRRGRWSSLDSTKTPRCQHRTFPRYYTSLPHLTSLGVGRLSRTRSAPLRA